MSPLATTHKAEIIGYNTTHRRLLLSVLCATPGMGGSSSKSKKGESHHKKSSGPPALPPDQIEHVCKLELRFMVDMEVRISVTGNVKSTKYYLPNEKPMVAHHDLSQPILVKSFIAGGKFYPQYILVDTIGYRDDPTLAVHFELTPPEGNHAYKSWEYNDKDHWYWYTEWDPHNPKVALVVDMTHTEMAHMIMGMTYKIIGTDVYSGAVFTVKPVAFTPTSAPWSFSESSDLSIKEVTGMDQRQIMTDTVFYPKVDDPHFTWKVFGAYSTRCFANEKPKPYYANEGGLMGAVGGFLSSV